MLIDIWKKTYDSIHEKIYSFKSTRKEPSEWVQETIYLTGAESNYSGFFNYDLSPYSREVIDCVSPTSPVEMFAVMKCSQSGFTQGVVVPGIAYIMSENPSNVMFLSGTETLVRDTVRDRLDPVIQNSGLQHLIRPNVQKKKNQKSGDTDFKKEFAGGSLTGAAYNPSKLRFYSVKTIFADEFDDAPRADKKEGSIRKLLENRTKSYGSKKKICYISSPTVKGQSNIEEVYLMGDQRKWNWECPHCETYIPMEWRVEKENAEHGGIVYKLDKEGKLIRGSVYYRCQNCGGRIDYQMKYDLNLKGKWIPTAEPKKPHYRSYQLNALVIPPGFDTWEDLVGQWLEANPKNEPVNQANLKTFLNTQLGQVWEELGTAPKVTDLMLNARESYFINTVPDKLSVEDGNGSIILITLACDLGGVMEQNNEDVRLDWEIIAHTANGQTYSINHGSIGTFKRNRKKSKRDRENESERDKYTYAHGLNFSVWPKLTEIIEADYHGQDGNVYNIDMTVIDTGHFTKLAYDFIKIYNNPFVVGVRGYGQHEYRKIQRDTPIIKRSQELLGKLYILQVNQLKDILASNMKLTQGMDGYQPIGFMNFPQAEDGQYGYRDYFQHYEGEHRIEEIKDGVAVGFVWKKKNSSVENHFFDTAVYNLAARDIFIDILRRSHTENRELTWELFCMLRQGNE